MYGPVSAEEIKNWIRQKRTKAHTKIIRVGENTWHTAQELPEFAMFFDETAQIAEIPQSPNLTGNASTTLSPHRAGAILACGIAGIFCCPILSILAWVFGQNDLKAMDEGIMDPSGRSYTKIGWKLGIGWTISFVLGFLIIIIYSFQQGKNI